MRFQFLGCGDAFGSGGRFNTCFHVQRDNSAFLIDCGASSMIAIRKFDVNPNLVNSIFISHLHGDHFGGLPFFILDAQFVSRRTTPLTIVGPPGLKARLEKTMECFFPGSTKIERRFELKIDEFVLGIYQEVNGIFVMPFVVNHPSGALACALRIAVDGKTICYSGDTEWVDVLNDAARNADLFVSEAYFPSRAVKFHLDLATLVKHLPAIGANRVILTHMSAEMLAVAGTTPFEAAEDGMVVTI